MYTLYVCSNEEDTLLIWISSEVTLLLTLGQAVGVGHRSWSGTPYGANGHVLVLARPLWQERGF
jgi:hypothetical protein